MIKTKVFAVNPFREVTYVVSDTVSGEAVVIDAGLQTEQETERFDDYIAKNNLKIIAAINTHLHIDHILGVSYVKEKYGVPFAGSSLELKLLKAGNTSARMFGMVPVLPLITTIDIDLELTKEIKFGESVLEVIPSPGHTVGGKAFFHRESNTLFTGDTLFKGSIGRTDLEGGDYSQLMSSIIDNILPLGPDVTIYPGHGDHSTLADEVNFNPFISEVLKGEVNYK